jgi:hypothetical protein
MGEGRLFERGSLGHDPQATCRTVPPHRRQGRGQRHLERALKLH